MLGRYRCLTSHFLLRRWLRIHLEQIGVVLFTLIASANMVSVAVAMVRIL
jgi:hypothetical protein